MTGLTFDVGANPGSFEIDTTVVPPLPQLLFATCSPEQPVVPSFTKGTITVLNRWGDVAPYSTCGDGLINLLDVVYLIDFVFRSGQAPCDPRSPLVADGIEPGRSSWLNQVVVESKTVVGSQTGATVAISIENNGYVSRISLPLIARSTAGGAFWSANLDSLPATGRLQNVLLQSRTFDDHLVDYVSPDQCFLEYVATFPNPCVNAGPLQAMTGLTFDVGPNPGEFEIDETVLPPNFPLEFLSCDFVPVPIAPVFTKGVITVVNPWGDVAPYDTCGDGMINLLDIVFLIDYVFRSGPAPCDPRVP